MNLTFNIYTDTYMYKSCVYVYICVCAYTHIHTYMYKQMNIEADTNVCIVVQSFSSCLILWDHMDAARQASLSFSISWSLLKLMSVESMMPSNHLILCRPLLFLASVFPSIRVFFSEWLFSSGIQSIGASASASVLPMNIQGWFPLGWTG